MICATTTLAYPKWPCVCLKVNMYYTYCIMSSFQTFLLPSIATSWPVTITVTVWQWCHASPNPCFQDRRWKKRKVQWKVKRNLGSNFISLTTNLIFHSNKLTATIKKSYVLSLSWKQDYCYISSDICTLPIFFQCGSHFIPIIHQSKNQILHSLSIS